MTSIKRFSLVLALAAVLAVSMVAVASAASTTSGTDSGGNPRGGNTTSTTGVTWGETSYQKVVQIVFWDDTVSPGEWWINNPVAGSSFWIQDSTFSTLIQTTHNWCYQIPCPNAITENF